MIYSSWLLETAQVSLSGRSFKAALLNDTYVTDGLSHATWSDVSSYEVSGTGYPAGGKPVVLTATAQDEAVRITCPNVDFGKITVNGIGAVVFYDATSGKLMAIDDSPIGMDVSVSRFVYAPNPYWGLALLSPRATSS